MKRERWFAATARGVWTLVGVALLTLLMSKPAFAVRCDGSFMGLNLGTYTGALSTAGTSSGTISCPSGFNYSIGLSAGVGSGATVALRKMTGPGSATLNYQIFQNSTRTTNWGNTVGFDARTGTGNNRAQTISIYPQIPANQFVAPGNYSDTVTVTVFNTSPLFSGSFSVVATVSATCTISATPLAFGNYTGAQNDATGTVMVTCTNTTPYNIALSVGLAAGATVTTRAMTGPGAVLLRYAMFREGARTLNWGNTVGTDTLVGRGTGRAIDVSVYGRVPAGQNARPGSYADTVIATVAY